MCLDVAARVPITVSPPLISFRETVALEDASKTNIKAEVLTANKMCKVIVTARPLPKAVVSLLESSRETIKRIVDSGEVEPQAPEVDDFRKNFRTVL